MTYNWQQLDWPDFRYNLLEVEETLYHFAEQAGHISGLLKAMPEDMQLEAVITMMVAEAIKTFEIEAEYLSRQDVMSSIRNNLGLNQSPASIKDKGAIGVGELMADVRRTYAAPLAEAKLFEWHQMIFKHNKRIHAGVWRSHEDPMQVVSGSIGKEKVHFEAPPSDRVPAEMNVFIQWFNHTAPGGRYQ